MERMLALAAAVVCAAAAWAGRPADAGQPSRDGTEETLTVLDPGAEPRRPLRYSVRAGDRSEMTIRMAMSVQSAAGDQPPTSVEAPPIEFAMVFTVASVAPDGAARAEYEVTRAELDGEGRDLTPERRREMRDMVQDLVGLKGYVVMTDRGETREAHVSLPDGAERRVSQMVAGFQESLRRLSSPFPEEPVGRGARWRVTRTPTIQGMRLDQTTTFELTEVANDRATLQVEVSQSAEPQIVQNEMVPAGNTLRVDSFTTRGDGRVEISLSQIVPVRSSLRLNSDQRMTLRSEGGTTAMRQEIRMEVSTTGRPAASGAGR